MVDTFCYGAICADHRIYLPHFPRPGEGMRIIEERWTPGGNALNEAMALARWGRGVVLGGDGLGDDGPGEVIRAGLAASSIDHHLVQWQPGGQTTVCRILITPDGERTILALRNNGAGFDLPPSELLATCRAVSLSCYGPGGARTVGQMARDAGCTLVVGDLLDPADPLAALADAICVSAAALGRWAGAAPVAALIKALQQAGNGAVFITDGPRQAQVVWGEAGALRSAVVQPPTISVRESVGAGDLFRAAVVDGLLDRLPWPAILAQAVQRASAGCLG